MFKPDEFMSAYIRKRPGMYIGGTGSAGLRHMVDDIVTEVLEHGCAQAERLALTLSEDGGIHIEVRGGSITPIDPDECDAGTSKPATNLGFQITSALSDRLEIEVTSDGKRQSRTFAAGIPTGPLEVAATTAPPSVHIRFRPDPTFFQPGTRLDLLSLYGRAVEWAVFNPHLRISIQNDADGQRRDYHYPDGLMSLAREEYCSLSAWRCRLREEDAAAEVVIVNRFDDGLPIIRSFVNGYANPGGGPHLDGLERGLKDLIRNRSRTDTGLKGRSRRKPLAGLTVLLSVTIEDPVWYGPTKSTLADDRAYQIVHKMIVEQLPNEMRRTRENHL